MNNKMIDEIVKNTRYPKRLLKGLDDIDGVRDYLMNNKLFSLNLRLTDMCNYRCIYCGTEDNRCRKCERELSTDEYIDLIHQAAELGAKSVVLGGNGEPTFTKNVSLILQEIHKLDMVPIMFTNAYIFGNDELCMKLHGVSGEEFLRLVDESDTSLIISCETTEPEKYNKIVGLDNAYESFSKSIERIKKTRYVDEMTYNDLPLCRIAISAVCMPINYEERFVMADFAHSINGLLVMKLPSLHGAAGRNRDKMFQLEDAREIKAELERVSDKNATLQVLNLACVAWTLGISISNDGNYMACMTNESNPYGENVNIRNTKIKDLLGKREELIMLKSTVCPVKDFYYADAK